MSRTPYENLWTVWNDVIEIINGAETVPDDLSDIQAYPNLETILQSIQSIYTGVDLEDDTYKYSPIFSTDSGLYANACIVLSGNYVTDAEYINSFLYSLNTSTNEHKYHYLFMGYMHNLINSTGDPYLGGFRKDTIAGVEMLVAQAWFTGHWKANKPAIVQLIPHTVYDVVRRVFEIIDEYTDNAYCFSSYLESCNQYYCAKQYDSLSEIERAYYMFNRPSNYDFSGEDYEEGYGPDNDYNPSFRMYSLQKFPIDYIYISSTGENPYDILGYGVWEAFGEGRVLVGVDPDDSDFDEALKTGGEKTHALTLDELPAHTHNYTRYATNNGYPTGANVTGGTLYYWKGNLQNNATTTSAGGGAAHNNMPPYITVYMFRRVA